MEAETKSTRTFRLRVKSLSKPGTFYDAHYRGGRWVCSCPASRYHHGACKHVRLLMALGLRRVRRFAVSSVRP